MSVEHYALVRCDAAGCAAILRLTGLPTFPHAEAQRRGWKCTPTPPPSGGLAFLDYCPDHRPETR